MRIQSSVSEEYPTWCTLPPGRVGPAQGTKKGQSWDSPRGLCTLLAPPPAPSIRALLGLSIKPMVDKRDSRAPCRPLADLPLQSSQLL